MSGSEKVIWEKTHFIFIIDCSGSMKGKRWEAVNIGIKICLQKMRHMKDILISGFSFDTHPNPFCSEKAVKEAISLFKELPFTGKGTNYDRALRYAAKLMKDSKHHGYLTCFMFLSDGKDSYPDEIVDELKQIRGEGQKFIFYTIACATDEIEDMVSITKALNGEHYNITTMCEFVCVCFRLCVYSFP